MKLPANAAWRSWLGAGRSQNASFSRFRTLNRQQFHNTAGENVPRASPKLASVSVIAGSAALSLAAITSLFSEYKRRDSRLDGRDLEFASTIPLSSTTPPKHDISVPNLDAAFKEIASAIGGEFVTSIKAELEGHSGSEYASHVRNPEHIPSIIAYPSSTEEVSAVVKICHRRRIPIIAYSGGTSIEGQYTATRRGICMDFSRMDQIIALHKEDLDVVVQPGVGWETLNSELADDNLFFPPDPGPGAMIGGMVGTGCSGTNAYCYGTMREWVISLTVVLADGTIIKTRQRPRKSSAGYDLTKMFIGSEGTLGLVTEATLKVAVLPESTNVAVATFETIKDAAKCVSQIVGHGLPLGAIEILDDVQMRCVNLSGMTERQWDEAPTLFFKFAGSPETIREQIRRVQGFAEESGSKRFQFARNDEEQKTLWSARKAALWSVMALREEGDRVWTGDVAVPISRLPELIEKTKNDLEESGLLAAIVGHAGDGNFHTILLYNDKDRQKAEDVVHRMVDAAIEMEGTVSGEHGVGMVKRDYLDHELGHTTVDAMRMLKMAFDPLCILNCDKVVRVEMALENGIK